MHIAFLTPEYPHNRISHSAGIGSSIKNLAEQLVAKGHKVTIFVYSQDSSEVIDNHKISIHKIAYKKYPFFSWYFYRKSIQNYINQVIKKENIDLIEAPDWTGITAFMRLSAPVIIRLHGTDTYFCHLEKRTQKIKNFLVEKRALKRADYLISVSEFTAIKTKELFNLKKKIPVIYNGIDTHFFSNTPKNEIPNSLLYFGSIIRKKGVLELAQIFNHVITIIPEATLTLLGRDVKDIITGTSTLALFTDLLSEKAKKNVIHINNVPYTEVKNHIAAASVIVLPSFAEAFPMTWLEAMAMKKALVTSNIGWANELMIDRVTGFSENPKNHTKYAEKIVTLLSDADLKSKFGENAQMRIRTSFSLETIGAKNIDYYKQIIK